MTFLTVLCLYILVFILGAFAISALLFMLYVNDPDEVIEIFEKAKNKYYD